MASVDSSAGVLHVDLQFMPHELYIRHSGENWAGITDRKTRKKLQNRLNKRVSRQRKRENGADNALASSSQSPEMSSEPEDIDETFHNCTKDNIIQKRASLERFAEQALTSYARSDPCADHRLKLMQLNIINAFTKNATTLGFHFDWLLCEVVSPFGPCSQTRVSEMLPPTPESLMPTSLQLGMKHHPWFDLFPLPKMRDNLLEAIATSRLTADGEQQLFEDVFESVEGGKEWSGLIVWGEPWNPRNWEVSVPFLKRWGWLLAGCPELLAATNHWRRRRGERSVPFPTMLRLV
ncbi:hypothetical protein HJFPF1_00079 [Paramyrothecium foliicola]|nr:hypothetical protein HJFPF1_00079 [Paramyrothecium foliicola]